MTYKKLRLARDNLNLSQAYVAKQVVVPRIFLQWYNGDLALLCKIYGLTDRPIDTPPEMQGTDKKEVCNLILWHEFIIQHTQK